jgi:hypothetical protein
MFNGKSPFYILVMAEVILFMFSGLPAQNLSDQIDRSRLYPHEMYITATGTGDTEEIARNKAIANIAQVIKVDINSQQKLVQKYFETGTGSDMELQMQSTFTRDIELATEQTLKNVFVDKTWFTEKEALYHAFAYMDRSETSNILKKDLKKLDEDISIYFQKYKEADTKLSRIAYLNKAINLAVQRDILMEQLNTISIGSESFTPSIKPADLVTARHDLAKETKVQLVLNYEKWEEFPGAVADVLQAFGFRIVDSDPDFTITGKMTMEKLERKGYFIGWHVELHFIDMAARSEFLTYMDNDREGHKSYGEAERRAAMRLANAIRKNFYKEIENYLVSLMGS